MKFLSFKKFLVGVLSAAMVLTSVPATGIGTVQAAEETGTLTSVESVAADGNVATITFNDGIQAKLTFLEDDIFRYNVDPSGEFSEYAKPRSEAHTAKIQQYPDSSDEYSHPAAAVTEEDGSYVISAGDTKVIFDKATAKMTVKSGDKTVMEETASLTLGSKTVQKLAKNEGEHFFGGGTQNGRFIHTGKEINIENESQWNDGGVSSPSPFYYSTAGYGVLRNTFKDGKYNFGAAEADTVTAYHEENEFDAYYFVSDADNNSAVVQDLLQGYFHVTGNPALLPAYGFYLGHLNAYNRDAWDSTTDIGSNWTIKGNGAWNSEGTTTYEDGGTGFEIKENQNAETLNGYGPKVFTDNVPEGVKYLPEFSARAVMDEYLGYDMPFGFFLPNDGYGAGYGQNGYQMTGGVNADGSSSEDRLAAVAANVQNLKEFAEYADSKGVATGLWTQSNLTPDSNPKTYWHILRDFAAEVQAGVTTLKTDVAWVGPGYSFQLNGVKQAYDIVTTTEYTDGRANTRPNIISLDGWAGSQRFNSVWTGDQTGGNWEYIRFHIPTFIGQSLAGNPNIGSDMDGIWGGAPVIATRDYQFKSFAPQMLDMDGWGSYAKAPYTHGDPYTGISRMYLKTKAMLMPYIYTNAYAASNIDTGNGDQGLPMVRAMFLEYPAEAESYGELAKYQYMWGENLLVAPVYENNAADDMGNDVRNGIFLPAGEGEEKQIWIDYFTGEQYRGGQVLNSFAAPIWKMPVFVKNGAIIPMYAEHNVADMDAENGVDKSQRIVEFWPAGSTEFNTIEDDGTYVENKQTEDEAYGMINDISYGDHVETLYTSEVDGTTATLTAKESTGTYPGYTKEKDTTFVVHASKEPTKLTAKNGETALEEVKVTSKAAFDSAVAEEGKFVSFYDATPAIETFASEEETLVAGMVKDVKVSGKLYVKFANTDSQANAQTLVIEGFENKGTLNEDKETELAIPENFVQNEEATTPTSITMTWDEVAEATSYEIMVDGSETLYTVVGGNTAFTHRGLDMKSTHTYKIRSVNAEGHSPWSEEFTFTSKEDPFINTPAPVSVDWPGGIYGSNTADKAFDRTFQQGDGGFHSDNTALQNALTVDYGNAYLFDKIEYTHRPGGGNGTVRRMEVSTSLDGVNWVKQPEYTFERNDDMKTMDLSDPNTGAETIGARYIRFQVKESVGNFFHASEIKPITIDGTNTAGNAARPFKVGNIVNVGLAEPTLTTFQQMYQKESSAHGSKEDPTWKGEIGNVYGDINFNGISDIYDYAFTAFQVDGGTKQTGSVGGNILLVPSAKSAKAGDEIKIEVMAMNVENLNAYGAIMDYDPALLEYKGVEYVGTGLMYTQGMTGNWNYDTRSFVNHNAINMGNMPLINGSRILATITMTAKADIAELTNDVIDLSEVTLMGPDYSTIVSEAVENPEIPEVPTVTEEKYLQSAFTITTTNDELTEDDGTNVEKLFQQGAYDPLFDGTDDMLEFKWDIESNHVEGKLPSYVKIPSTMDFAFNTPSKLDKVVLKNRDGGNGTIQTMTATITFEDGTEQSFSFDTAQAEYVLTVAEENTEKNVTNVAITPTKTTNPQMLSMREIEFWNTTGVEPTEIVLDENNKTEVYAGYFEPVNASVLPAECPNQYFTVTSSDENIASIITMTDADGAPLYYVRGVAEGTATITVASAADESVTASYEVTVIEGVDKSELNDIVQETTGVVEDIYTPETYAAYKAAYDAAVEVFENPDASRADVENAVFKLQTAYAALTTVPVGEEQVIITADLVESAEALYSESNTPDRMFDGSLDTYWESPYNGSNVGLPKDIVVTLKETTMLEQLTFISHTIRNGGVTKYSVAVSEDGTNWTPVAKGSVDSSAYDVGENVRVDVRFAESLAKYVKMTVLGTAGSTPESDNEYGRIAEMKFYGVDKSALAEAVENAKTFVQDNYTDESWAALQTAIGNAETTIANKAAAQAAVDKALADLNAAVEGLTEKTVDKTDLEGTIDNVEKEDLNKKDYTEETWKAFEKALANAKAVLAKEDATQEEVNAAMNALKDARAALKKTETKPEEPETPEGPGTPGTGDKPSGGNGSGSGSSGNNAGGGSAQSGAGAKTGDTAQTTMFMTLLVCAAAAVIMLRRKSRLTK